MWAGEYLTIPFVDHGRDHSGCDCYGLGRLVLKEQKNIELPSLLDVYDDIKDTAKLQQHITYTAAQEKMWQPIPKNNEQEFDFIIMRIMGLPVHMGIVTRKGWMLHIIDGSNANEVPYTKGEWSLPGKIIGFYRHKELCKQ